MQLTIYQFMKITIKPFCFLLVIAFVSCSPVGHGESQLVSVHTPTYFAEVIPEPRTTIPYTLTPVPSQTVVNIIFTATPKPTDVSEGIKKLTLDQVKPSPGEEKLQKAKVFIDSVEIKSNALLPDGMLEAAISGSLPTPCHVLRADMKILEEERQIQIEMYSLVDPGKSCIQVLEPFDLQIPVDLENEGKYRVLVNQVEMSQFDWPEKP